MDEGVGWVCGCGCVSVWMCGYGYGCRWRYGCLCVVGIRIRDRSPSRRAPSPQRCYGQIALFFAPQGWNFSHVPCQEVPLRLVLNLATNSLCSLHRPPTPLRTPSTTARHLCLLQHQHLTVTNKTTTTSTILQNPQYMIIAANLKLCSVLSVPQAHGANSSTSVNKTAS